MDLGVTSDNKYRESNYFEQFYPYKNKIVCAGTEDGSYLEQNYPGVTFVIIKAHHPLPFYDQQFDIVFSNAVIEHTGGVIGQRFFIKEILYLKPVCHILTWTEKLLQNFLKNLYSKVDLCKRRNY